MPPAFDHVLLTRFSAVMSLSGEPMPSEWLDYRLRVFYDACYPSVTRQRGAAAFTWLVMLDDRCPDDFRELVEELAPGAFTPVWTHEPFERNSFVAPVLAATGPEHAEHLVTTRIDSDDAMAVDFMARVQAEVEAGAEAAGRERLFVNFPRGIQIDRTGAVYRTTIASSPFLSLVERRTADPPDTVFVVKHARASAAGPVLQVDAPVMWAQVVHGVNVSNILNGTQTSPAVVEQRFDLDLGYDAALAGAPLRRAQAQQLRRLATLWAGHPGELTKWVEAQVVARRGRHVRAQDDGQSLSDTLLDRQARIDLAWHSSGVRRRARKARHDLLAARWRLRSRLNAHADGRPHLVAGDPAQALAAPVVVVLAEYATGSHVRPDALGTARAYAEAGAGVLVVAARDLGRPVAHPGELPDRVSVLTRANAAYDFGSWAAVLAAYPELTHAEHVVLTNDSLVGPFAPLDDLLDRIRRADVDLWAATRNHRPVEHLQSFLLAVRGSVLTRPEVAGFFAEVGPQPTKRAIIEAYEFGLTRLARTLGLSTAVGWTHEELGLPEQANPAFDGWRELLDAGFPFVKRMLLTTPHLRELGALVRDYVAKQYPDRPLP